MTPVDGVAAIGRDPDASEGSTPSTSRRCHRRIIGDLVKVEYDVSAERLMHDGGLTEHRVSDDVRVGDDGRLVWDDGISA